MAEYVNKYCLQQFKVLVSVTKDLELPKDEDEEKTFLTWASEKYTGVRMVEGNSSLSSSKFCRPISDTFDSTVTFGKEAFATKDLNDAMEFYKFLDLCFKMLVMKKSSAREIVKKYFRSLAVLPKSRYRRSKRRKSLMKKRRELGSMWPGM